MTSRSSWWSKHAQPSPKIRVFEKLINHRINAFNLQRLRFTIPKSVVCAEIHGGMSGYG